MPKPSGGTSSNFRRKRRIRLGKLIDVICSALNQKGDGTIEGTLTVLISQISSRRSVDDGLMVWELEKDLSLLGISLDTEQRKEMTYAVATVIRQMQTKGGKRNLPFVKVRSCHNP